MRRWDTRVALVVMGIYEGMLNLTLGVCHAQVLCALLVLFFGLGGWLALSRTVNEYIPCRVSSMFFFPAYVLLLAVVKHRYQKCCGFDLHPLFDSMIISL